MAKQSKPTSEIEDKHNVSTGADFEHEVADYMEESIFSGDWGISPHFAKVRRKPAYFSRTRNGDIIFDVSVEIFMKADPVHPMFIWILECKDYESRNVNVDEVEEFHHKIQQVGAHKGLIFTRHGFATGAIEVARTHKIGLSILKRGKVMLLEASATGGLFWVDEIEASFWLTSEGTEKSASFSEVLRRELHKFDILILPVKRNKRRVLKEELTNNNTESNEP